MDQNTGRIELVATEEDRLDAKKRGLIPLSAAEAQQLALMTRKRRIECAAERDALVSLHFSIYGGKTRNQRKAERKNRGKNRRTNRG